MPNAAESHPGMRPRAGDRLASFARRRPLAIYFSLAFAISWLFLLPLGLSRTGIGFIPVDVPIEITAIATFGPSISAFLTQRLVEGNWQAFKLYTSGSRLLMGVIVGPILIACVYAVMPAVAVARSPLTALHWRIFGSLSVFNRSTLLGGPLGEEPGWRGFALPRLQVMLGPVRASVLLGCIWAAWHLPLFLVKGWSSASILEFVLILIGLSVLLTWAFNASGSSVIVAALMHATFNTSPGWIGGLLAGAAARDYPSPEFVMALCGLCMAGLIAMLTRGHLAAIRSSAVEPPLG